MWAAPSATRRSSSWRRAPCWAPGERRTENGKRRTERPCGATGEAVGGCGGFTLRGYHKEHKGPRGVFAPGEQRTENGEQNAPAGRRVESLERCERLTLRGYHKGHEEAQRDTKGGAGAGRACAQGARPARGPERAWRASHATLWGGALTRHFTVPKRLERRLSAKRRAAGAVSGGAAERPMEPEAIRASPCVFAENFTEGHWDAPTGDAGDSGAPLRGDGETP